VKFLPSTKRTYVSYEIDLYIKLPVKINNITNKLLEKLRESEGEGGVLNTRISSTVVGLSNSSLGRGPWEGD